MVLFALLNASTCFGVYPVVSRAANQTTVVAVPVLCTAGAVVAPLPAAAPAAVVGAAPPLVPPPPQATNTPALADIASPFKRLRRLSRACHRRSSLTVLTPSLRPFPGRQHRMTRGTFLPAATSVNQGFLCYFGGRHRSIRISRASAR